MAWATGTADDFIDFLRKLREYAAGNASFPLATAGFDGGTTVGAGDVWTILTNGAGMPDLPGAGFATDGEMYLQGQGDDVDDEIIIGFRTYRNAGNNLFGIESRGYTQFNDLLTFETLPGVSPPCYSALDDAAFDFQFWVNRRRIMAVAMIGTTNVFLHSGFLKRLGSRSQYPYPLLISGCQLNNLQNFQANNFGQSSLPDPCDNSTQLRWIDGSWQEVANYSNNSATRSNAKNLLPNYQCWPLSDPTSPPASGSGEADTSGNEQTMFENYALNASIIMSPSEINLYSLFPAVLMSNLQHIGHVDGLFVAGGLGLVSGDIIQESGDDYDVFSNTYRSEVVDYYAVLREQQMPFLKLVSVASFDSLLEEIRDFLNGTGDWTIHRDLTASGNGRQLIVSQGTCLAGLQSVASGAGANCLYLFDGVPPYSGSPAIDQLPNNSGLRINNLALAGGDTSCRYMNQHAGPLPTAWLFSNDPSTYCHVVVEVIAGVFKHLTFGNLKKYGGWTGGGYYGVTNWSENVAFIDQPDSSSHRVPFDNLTDFGAIRQNTTVYYVDAADKWLAEEAIVNTVQRRQLRSTFRGGFGRAWVNLSETPYSGLIALAPVLVGKQRLSDSPDTLRWIGEVPDMAALNIQNLAPGEEYSIGSDIWLTFPLCAKLGGTDAFNSGVYGAAYLKHV